MVGDSRITTRHLGAVIVLVNLCQKVANMIFGDSAGEICSMSSQLRLCHDKATVIQGEVELANVIPITLEELDGEARKSTEEYLKEVTQEALMRACTRTCQGVIVKPGPRIMPNFDVVSSEEVSQSIQKQIASTIDSSIVTLNTKLNASIENHIEGFLRTKFGPLMADFMFKDKASTSASQAPID